MSYFETTRINSELVLGFILRFARMEFALKRCGYALGNEREVRADWDRFAARCVNDFNMRRSPELEESCQFYLANPPLKQVMINGSLGWSTDLPLPIERRVELLIALVRRVRNNLFHGGKYDATLHEEVARSTRLLAGGIRILDECLVVADDVRVAFDEAQM